MGVAATARCRNAGIALNPTIAIPPCFKKYRRENFNARTPSQQRSLISASPSLLNFQRPLRHARLLPLKLRRAQHPGGESSQYCELPRIIQLGLHSLRIVELRFEGLNRRGPGLPAEEN